ncbi:OmpW/AlkL family protein [Pseudorhodoferax sp.]|uniref:OmpW/AlkL family protein n=1 Tax=Pseudorhodoferax sp. TaxID=1993553 RepID=UPI0039E2D3FE
MPKIHSTLLACLLAGLGAQAPAQTPVNSIQLGVAGVDFNAKSRDMTGPAGTTPPGIRADVRDKTVFAFVYDRRIDGPWSVTFQGGLPPVLKLKAAGTAAALGGIGSVRAWFPAVMGTYTWDAGPAFALHAGAGLHYTFFTDGTTNAVYDGAFGGTSSRARFSSSLGPIIKLGGTWSIDHRWFLDLSYSKYWIKTTATVTTATPGVGDIERKVKVRTSPDVLALTVGYRF